MVLPTRRQLSIGITIMTRWNYRQTGLIEHSTSASHLSYVSFLHDTLVQSYYGTLQSQSGQCRTPDKAGAIWVDSGAICKKVEEQVEFRCNSGAEGALLLLSVQEQVQVRPGELSRSISRNIQGTPTQASPFSVVRIVALSR